MGATFSVYKTFLTGEVLTAADLNSSFSTFITNLTPSGIDDESTNDAAAQATSDPYPAAALAKATSLQTEIQQIRYQLAAMLGETYWYIDPDTTMAAVGSLAGYFGYGTIWVPAGAMIPTTTNGATSGTYEYPTSDIMFDYFAFDDATEEYVAFNIVMPENWSLGTIKAKFFWSSATGSTTADTVEWEIAAGALSDSDAIDAALGTSQVISDALLADNGTDIQVTSATPALTVGGTPALGDLVRFKVSRNVGGTDNMEEDAWLFGVLIQYTISAAVAAW